MSTFWIIYIIAAVIAGAVILYINWQERKEGKVITLGDLLLSLFFTFCPVVNGFVAFFGGAWFIFNESPKIVIAGRRE